MARENAVPTCALVHPRSSSFEPLFKPHRLRHHLRPSSSQTVWTSYPPPIFAIMTFTSEWVSSSAFMMSRSSICPRSTTWAALPDRG